MVPGLAIVPATPDHAEAIAAIYAHHVLHGTASFETVPPNADEIVARMEAVRKAGLPWLVAEDREGTVLGYAYAAKFRERAAYRYACENSIYLRHDCLGRGIGTRLLMALLPECEAAGYRQVIAGISGSEPASIALHAKAGFVEAARYKSVGRKHGKWIDVIHMQRALGPGDTEPPGEEPQ